MAGSRVSSQIELHKICDTEIDDPEAMASRLNEFFAGVGETLAQKIPILVSNVWKTT